MRSRCFSAFLLVSLLFTARPSAAESKFVSLDGFPSRNKLEVAPDGSRVYISGSDYLVLDDQGKLVKKIAFSPWGTGPINFIPLPDGWFIAGVRGLSGRVDLHRPDGSVAKTLVSVGGGIDHPHLDANWANPDGIAVDTQLKRIFVLDSTKPPPPLTPDWSRIAMFDYSGAYIGDIAHYDAKASDAKDHDDLRVTYSDIDVDPARQRVYVSCQRGSEIQEIRAFSYDGKLVARVKTPVGGGCVAVLPDGRVVGTAGSSIFIFSADLQKVGEIKPPAGFDNGWPGIQGLRADQAGRLYATTPDPGVIYIRWSADFTKVDIFRTRYMRVNVEFPAAAFTAGIPFDLKVSVLGNPDPPAPDWQVMARPDNGTDLTWKPLSFAVEGGLLHVTPPADLNGIYELAVRAGKGPIVWAARSNDPFIQRTVGFLPRATQSVAVMTSSGRSAFVQGEDIPLQLMVRSDTPQVQPVRMELRPAGARPVGLPSASLVGPPAPQAATAVAPPLLAVTVDAGPDSAFILPSRITRRLAPGHYILIPSADGYQSYAAEFDVSPPDPDSPMQRILYTEFGGGGSAVGNTLDTSERVASVRDYVDAMARLGFTRETDRSIASASNDGPRAWNRDQLPVPLTSAGAAPPQYYQIPNGDAWPEEYFRDLANKYGIKLDGQLLGHCAGVPVADASLNAYVEAIQRYLEWLDRYPSSYGVNYNDEMFFRLYGWSDTEENALKAIINEKFKDKPVADAYKYCLGVMYDRFNAAVRQVDPNAHITTTPMWQFPAVEGSYVPTIYKGMTETYGHYMTEGEHVPWYAVHDTEFLRRPGLATMGVFDNGHSGGGGDLYLEGVMQQLGLGVQGVGVALTNALGGPDRNYADPPGADAYRVANTLAKMYGPVFAETTPVRDAAVLYSYTQDVTEHRNFLGTPHWERVYEMLGAGLMAGVAESIVYEEDISANWLLRGDKPRFPMLFLVGQTQELPEPVKACICHYLQAGGHVFADADSTALTFDADGEFKAVKLNLDTYRAKEGLAQNENNDSMWPVLQPVFEKLAADLKAAVGQYRQWPVEADEPWLEKTSFDGGAAHYMMFATETSPYPWAPGTVWASGAQYMRSYLPRVVNVSFPAANGVIYDVFDHRIVNAARAGGRASLAVDLRNFPGRLFAVVDAKLAPPEVTAAIDGPVVKYDVRLLDEHGQNLAARVPLRIQLVDEDSGTGQASPPVDIYRGTDGAGLYSGLITIPAGPARWRLEVTELIGGNAGAVELEGSQLEGSLVAYRPDVDIQRPGPMQQLIRTAQNQGSLTVVMGRPGLLTSGQQQSLEDALLKLNIKLLVVPAMPEGVTRGTLLAVGVVQGEKSPNGSGNGPAMGDLLGQARRRGLFTYPITSEVPGPGRGLITALLAPRGFGENAIALVGGDSAGLGRSVDVFVEWLAQMTDVADRVTVGPPAVVPSADAAPEVDKILAGHALARHAGDDGFPVSLAAMVGVKLNALSVSPDGLYVVIGAAGYQKNLVLVRDEGDRAAIVRTARVGDSPRVDSLFVSSRGSLFGASGGDPGPVGEGFHLIQADSGKEQEFGAFGFIPPFMHRFAASSDGRIVIAPGANGVVCWKRQGRDWGEIWSIDYWKEFQKLDWPVDASDERLPQFHAYIPDGADYALIVFAETTNNGWVVAEHKYTAWMSAVDLNSGAERWRFKIPIPDTLLFPTLQLSPDGSRIVLQVQKDSFGKETYRFFSIDNGGVSVGSWDSKSAPVNIAVANGTGWIAEAYKDRLLEVRNPDGSVVYNLIWPGADPVSIVFAEDGKSLYVADDADHLTRMSPDGQVKWQVPDGSVSRLAAVRGRVYAAGWDGRLRAFSPEGTLAWNTDLTPSLQYADPPVDVVADAKGDRADLFVPLRSPVTSAVVPAGENLLRTDQATVTVGGTPGWLSKGLINVKAEDLVNGQFDDVNSPWLPLSDANADGATGRQVWVEVAFKQPATVHSLTVYENKNHPESWPTDGLVQVWDEGQKRWNTAARGVFLSGPITTYKLDLGRVSKIRYVPWSSYFRNFYTSEIEVR